MIRVFASGRHCTAAWLLLIAALAFPGAQSSAADGDEALVQALEQSPAFNTIRAVSTRLESGQLNDDHSDRVLSALAAYVADDDVVVSSDERYIVEAIGRINRPFPDPAFAALLNGLEHRAMLNVSAAIAALGTMPANDSRRSTAIDALSGVLRHHPHQHSRTSAAQALSMLGRSAALPATAIDALAATVADDDYVTVRIDAADALSFQSIGRQRASDLTTSLAAELIAPTAVTQRARGLVSIRLYPARARNMLLRLFSPPYPAHVVDVLISQAGDPDYSDAVAALEEIVRRDGISEEQQQALLVAARRAYSIEHRLAIYSAVFAATTAEELASARAVLGSRDHALPGRIAAAYRLRNFYASAGVPADIADVAARLVTATTDGEFYQANALLLLAAVDADSRTEQHIAGLRAQSTNREAYPPIIHRLPLRQLEQLILQSATEERYSSHFRYTAIRLFQDRAEPGSILSPELEDTLVTVANGTDDYLLSQSAGRALEAWGASKPLRLSLANRDNQSSALGILYLVLLLVNAGAAILGFIAILSARVNSQGKSIGGFRRTVLVTGWLLLTLGMLIVAAIGFFGFLGHGFAPSPGDSLMFNVPFYLGTAIYVWLAWAAFKAVRRPASSATKQA